MPGVGREQSWRCAQTGVMTDLILAEEVFLLTHNEESGKASGAFALNSGLAGALLLDLAAQELVDAVGETITAVAGTPSHALLASAHSELLQSSEPRTAKQWVIQLPKALKPIGWRVGQSLVDRGVLEEQRSKVLGLFPTTRWPETDPAPEQELRRRLTDVLVGGAEPDPHTALLISLVSALRLVRRLVDKDQRKQAETRAKDIAAKNAEAMGTSAVVSRAVQAVEAAVTAIVISQSSSSTG
jgi:hypothetical protein